MPAADTHSVARTVLLADDSPTIQRVVELTFAGENVRVVAVGDGSAAIDAIRKSPPDVVLADIGMPGRTGYDVLEFVRSQPGLSNVPVLLLAGAFEQIDQAQVARMGADGVLSKPFDPLTLIGRVGELLTRGRTAAQAPSTSSTAPPAAAAAPPATPSSGAPPSSPERERYFEELDQAFAALTRSPRPLLRSDEREPQLDEASAPPASEPPANTAADAEPPPLTDAFAALLDAERTGTPLETLWPPARAVASEPVDIERLADLVARRVLEQLSDRVLRETVAEIVSTTAERLVREEIDRIKRHIK
jgi:CheY-like chemotaxis protein